MSFSTFLRCLFFPLISRSWCSPQSIFPLKFPACLARSQYYIGHLLDFLPPLPLQSHLGGRSLSVPVISIPWGNFGFEWTHYQDTHVTLLGNELSCRVEWYLWNCLPSNLVALDRTRTYSGGLSRSTGLGKESAARCSEDKKEGA